MTWPSELPRLEDFLNLALHWDEFSKEAERQNRLREEAERKAREAAEAAKRQEDARQELIALTRSMQAYKLSEHLPHKLDQIKALLQDQALPLDVRGKILEVMLFRGATNEHTYEEMKPEYAYAHAATLDYPQNYAYLLQYKEHAAEYMARCAYQEAVRDAVFGEPRLFDQLSQSKDQMPQSRQPATEFMNTMLRNGGLYGNDDARQEFEQKLLGLPAETRGRAMYHIVDAAHNSGTHLKGERRATGESWEISIGVEPISGGFGYGSQWEHVADNHWVEVGNDIRLEMNSDMDKRDQAYKDDHEEGFKKAAKPAGKLPGE